MIEIIIGFFTGVIASLGLGGGFVLIIYLVTFMGVEQMTAQGINLTFFIPIAILSLIIHSKNKMVEWKKVPKYSFTGVLGAIAGTFIALNLNSHYLKIIFAILLIIVGIRELFHKDKKE